MRRFRWWLSALLAQWAEAIEPQVDTSIRLDELMREAMSKAEYWDEAVKNNALLQRIVTDYENQK